MMTDFLGDALKLLNTKQELVDEIIKLKDENYRLEIRASGLETLLKMEQENYQSLLKIYEEHKRKWGQ